jgi:hypothetical protein
VWGGGACGCFCVCLDVCKELAESGEVCVCGCGWVGEWVCLFVSIDVCKELAESGGGWVGGWVGGMRVGVFVCV